jgi:hypothetical protein
MGESLLMMLLATRNSASRTESLRGGPSQLGKWCLSLAMLHELSTVFPFLLPYLPRRLIVYHNCNCESPMGLVCLLETVWTQQVTGRPERFRPDQNASCVGGGKEVGIGQ